MRKARPVTGLRGEEPGGESGEELGMSRKYGQIDGDDFTIDASLDGRVWKVTICRADHPEEPPLKNYRLPLASDGEDACDRAWRAFQKEERKRREKDEAEEA